MATKFINVLDIPADRDVKKIAAYLNLRKHFRGSITIDSGEVITGETEAINTLSMVTGGIKEKALPEKPKKPIPEVAYVIRQITPDDSIWNIAETRLKKGVEISNPPSDIEVSMATNAATKLVVAKNGRPLDLIYPGEIVKYLSDKALTAIMLSIQYPKEYGDLNKDLTTLANAPSSFSEDPSFKPLIEKINAQLDTMVSQMGR